MANPQVILNGASNIARSVMSAFLAKNKAVQALRLVDARPYRSSVYRWQKTLGSVKVNKHLARSA